MKFRNLGLVLLAALIFTQPIYAEERKQDTTEYLSDYDKSLTFQKVTYLPSIDNLNNIYAKHIDVRVDEMIKNNPRWDYVQSHIAGSVVKPEDIVNDPKKVREFSKHLNADAFFISEVRKDPKNTFVSLYLFSAYSGELIAEEKMNRPNENTDIVTSSVTFMMKDIIKKIPYDALVISRVDNRVTINAGSADGVRSGQSLTAVKIISAEKHPKRNFLIKTNKVLVGQIRVVKADKYISFADIVSESEPGVLNRGAKITGITKMRYQKTPWTNQYTPPEQILTEDNKVVFGKDA
ncbi:MAG: hypothetical protein HRT44_03225, partial [Bdellovibrionales bacterium]|nr:hypothetical protein [Bdellovibrionales bacterium]NQZ18258.1 hypothetical protein [Bdellovibrionales bacterium]